MGRSKRTPAKKTVSPLVWAIPVAIALIVALVLLFTRTEPVVAPGAEGAAQALPAEVSVAEAAQKRDAGAFILDVRTPEEWDEVHIPDATLIPLSELPGRLSEVPKDQEVVVVCRSGNRSAQAREILREAGYSQTTSMAGGMNDWVAQGLPTTTGP